MDIVRHLSDSAVKDKNQGPGRLHLSHCFFAHDCGLGRFGRIGFITGYLKGGLVTAHITLSVAGEALFALASCAGAMYLIQDRLIKYKTIGSFSRLLPSLKDLDKINYLCLLWGFPLLTLGVLAGSIWARTVWGSHWQWDPKQIWTLTTWLLYALLLHQRLAIGWKGHRVALFSLLAFILLLIGFIVEKLFFTTVHNFM